MTPLVHAKSGYTSGWHVVGSNNNDGKVDHLAMGVEEDVSKSLDPSKWHRSTMRHVVQIGTTLGFMILSFARGKHERVREASRACQNLD